MAQHLLEGFVVPDDSAALRQEIEQLKSEIETLQGDLTITKRQSASAVRAISELRRVLAPLHNAVRMIFGEIESAGVSEEEGVTPTNSRVAAVWESWKQKLPGKRADIIQALLEHGEMTVAQLRVATHSGTQTIYENVSKLNGLGLITKSGNGMYKLKQL